MTLFFSEIVTPPAALPIDVGDADPALAAAVVEEIERSVLCRAIVAQTRRILIDGDLPLRLELEPVNSITSLTRYTPDDDAEIIPDDEYGFVSRDPSGAIVVPLNGWPAPERSVGSFVLTYESGWIVTPETAPGAGDAVNKVPASIRLMVDRAISFRSGSGLGDIDIGSLKMRVAKEYSTDRLPASIASIGRAWVYRPGIFAARP